SVRAVALGAPDRSGENPGVPPPDRLVAARLEPQADQASSKGSVSPRGDSRTVTGRKILQRLELRSRAARPKRFAPALRRNRRTQISSFGPPGDGGLPFIQAGDSFPGGVRATEPGRRPPRSPG